MAHRFAKIDPAMLRRWAGQMQTASERRDPPSFYLADYEFHQELYRLSGNPFLFQACQAVAAAPFAYILCKRVEPLPEDHAALAEDYQQIVDALGQGPRRAVAEVRSKVGKRPGWQTESLASRG